VVLAVEHCHETVCWQFNVVRDNAHIPKVLYFTEQKNRTINQIQISVMRSQFPALRLPASFFFLRARPHSCPGMHRSLKLIARP
jgi:hypothetical protein